MTLKIITYSLKLLTNWYIPPGKYPVYIISGNTPWDYTEGGAGITPEDEDIKEEAEKQIILLFRLVTKTFMSVNSYLRRIKFNLIIFEIQCVIIISERLQPPALLDQSPGMRKIYCIMRSEKNYILSRRAEKIQEFGNR